MKLLDSELLDFCYYLATKVDMLDPDAYVVAPDSDSKYTLIADMMPAAQKLAYLFKLGRIADLEELINDYDGAQYAQGWSEGKVEEEKLFDLYLIMTDGQGTKRGLSKVLTEAGLSKHPTTKDGAKLYYYDVPKIRGFSVSPFDEIDTQVKGL
jgi:hypothetical protein